MSTTYEVFSQAQATIVTGYQSVVVSNLPFGYWGLADTSGTTAVAIKGSNGTYSTTGLTLGVYAAMPTDDVNKAVSLNGSGGSQLLLNSSTPTNSFSMEAWVNPNRTINIATESNSGTSAGTNNSQNYVFFPDQKGTDRGLGMSVGTNGIQAIIHGNNTIVPIASYSATISTTWHHVVITLDAKVPKIYLDGVLVRTGITATATNVYAPTRMFGTSGNSYGPYNGQLNNGALYDYVLDADQILNHYQAGVPRAVGQAQALIINIPVAQAQAQILAFDFPQCGQAQADIVQGLRYNGLAQAQTIITDIYETFAQASVWIRDTYAGFAQANAWILPSTQVGQANVGIKQTYPLANIEPNLTMILRPTSDEWTGSPTLVNSDTYYGAVDEEVLSRSDYYRNTISNSYMRHNFTIPADQYPIGGSYVIDSVQITVDQYTPAPSGGATYRLVDPDTGTSYTVLSIGQNQNGTFSSTPVTVRPWDSQPWTHEDILALKAGYYAPSSFASGYIYQFYVTVSYHYAAPVAQTAALIYQTRWYPSGQAQAAILNTYTQSAQAAALIDNYIKVQFAQAEAYIFLWATTALSLRVIEAQSLPTTATSNITLRVITQRPIFGLAQATAYISNSEGTTVQFGQASTWIKAVGSVVIGQAQAWVRVFAVSTFYVRTIAEVSNPDTRLAAHNLRVIINRPIFSVGQAKALIQSPIKNAHAQAHVSIYRTPHITYEVFGQAQANIRTKYRANANARASILRTYTRHAQAMAFIFHPQEFAQAQAHIKHTKTVVTANAQAYVRLYVGYAQANAWIDNVITKTGQARAYMRLYVGYGQAQADIKTTYQARAQAAGAVLFSGMFAQATADIWQQYQVYGQAAALIDNYIKVQFAQAQAELIFIQVSTIQIRTIIDSTNKETKISSISLRAITNRATFRSGQAAALIFNYTKVFFGQAQANIRASSVYSGQAEAYLSAYGVIGTGQAEASILKLAGYGQAQAYFRAFGVPAFGQALAYSLGFTFVHAQAEVYIKPLTGLAQVMASIKRAYTQQAQTQAMIEIVRRGYAQAEAWILYTTSIYIATAQAQIQYRTFPAAQAQAEITQYKHGWANAMAQIAGLQHAQSMALIRAVSIPTAQAGALIKDKYTMIIYNGYLLPGYLQSESIQDSSRIKMYSSPYFDDIHGEYIGLETKIISLQFKLLGETYDSLKTQATKASTMVWSAKKEAKLYIHSLDNYYLAIPKTFKILTSAKDSTLDYTVDFSAQPWLYSNIMNTITGTTTLVTTGRTFNDGVDTPATVKITGTNITVSGYTADNLFTGYFAVSGAVTDLIIDSANYTATIDGVNKNGLMRNLDYQIYVGEGVTYFNITGATSAEISWRNRW